MTCDETREFLLHRPAATVTRGERAAVYGHLMKCPECVRFMEEEMDKTPAAVRSLSHGIGEKLHYEDIQDPEFVRTVYGDWP